MRGPGSIVELEQLLQVVAVVALVTLFVGFRQGWWTW